MMLFYEEVFKTKISIQKLCFFSLLFSLKTIVMIHCFWSTDTLIGDKIHELEVDFYAVKWFELVFSKIKFVEYLKLGILVVLSK